MKTRIREVRKTRGLTLQQLAEKVGTTAQTIQRLETGNMTISLVWLEKISHALDLSISDLLAGDSSQRIEVVGMLGADGRVLPTPNGASDGHVVLGVSGIEPVAVRVHAPFGRHEAGTVLFGAKLSGDSVGQAHGRDCIVATRDGAILVRHAAVDGKRLRLSGPQGHATETATVDVVWVAPITMSVRYFS
ncbi:MAG TPA: helix-turn-helix transcriptional regulator [Hyphomicrobiaceae bacterium]|nr:helix-turn-helix transcriptional regulator [Hyphomicrobiaceae bacterium]